MLVSRNCCLLTVPEPTPPSSPVHKKPRLLSQGCALDHASGVQPSPGFSKAIALSDITDDPENPFTTSLAPGSGFALASSSKVHQPETWALPLEPSTEQNHEAWLNPVSFQTATLVSSPGFVSLRSKVTLAPSAAALAQAQARLKEIWDNESENVNPLVTTKDQFATQAQTNAEPAFHRPALQALDNRSQTPSTPTPTELPRPSALGKQPQAIDQFRVKQKPFRSPLLKNTPKSRFMSSPVKLSTDLAPATKMSSHDPTMLSTPLRPNLLVSKLTSFQTPARAPANTQRTTPAPFVTPFKPGMRPGEPGWAKLQASIPKGSTRSVTHASTTSLSDPSRRPEAKLFKSFFNLRRSCIMPFVR